MNLTVIDYLIAILLICGLIGAGYWGRRFVKSVAHFTIAGRKMGMWLGLSTGLAEGIGLVSVALGCQMGFTGGFSFIWLLLAALFLINIPLFGILGLGIERFRATNVHTLPQYYEMRFSRPLRIFAGVTLGIGGVMNMAIFPIVESNLLIAFLGLPENFTFLGIVFQTFAVILFSLLVLALFFTMIGGMVSVILTDYIQSVLMFVTLTTVSILIFWKAGIANMKTALDVNLGDAAFLPTRSFGIVFAISFLLSYIIHRLAFPPVLQKMSSAESPKVVRKMFLLSQIFGQGKAIMYVLWGIAALVLIGPAIPDGNDPEMYQRILGGILVIKVAPPVLLGLVFAGFLFASISTNDSYLLSWGAVITNDVLCAVRIKPMSSKQHLLTLRLVALGIAIFIFFFGLWYDPKENIVQYMVLTGAIFGGCGLITWFGLYWKRATTAGAWWALVLAIVLPLGWIVFQQEFSHILKDDTPIAKILTQDNVTLFSMIFPAIVLVLVSLVTKRSHGFVDFGVKVKEMNAGGKTELTQKEE